MLLIAVGSMGSMGIRRAVLPLEADVLIDDQMAGARVDRSADGKSDDHACASYKYDGE
jgi:hypothetical protein